jgi:inositol oxygenase
VKTFDMAPSAIEIVPAQDDRDFHALEDLSDNIDAVNVVKANMKEKAMSEKLEFDAEKDKTKFRQYEEACDRVKGFYWEQHQKQTAAYNLKA